MLKNYSALLVKKINSGLAQRKNDEQLLKKLSKLEKDVEKLEVENSSLKKKLAKYEKKEK